MTNEDIEFVQRLLVCGIIRGPVLELGAGYGGETSREMVERAGLEYQTTDVCTGPGVDYVADFEADSCLSSFPHRNFGTVLVLNVLEHVFAPIEVLDNSVKLTRPGGTVIVITPCMWPVHNYPRDYQRLLPDWYITYAERRQNVRLVQSWFEFMGRGPISKFARGEEHHLPSPWRTALASIYSRAVHKCFNTSGRGHWTSTHSAIGAVFHKI